MTTSRGAFEPVSFRLDALEEPDLDEVGGPDGEPPPVSSTKSSVSTTRLSLWALQIFVPLRPQGGSVQDYLVLPLISTPTATSKDARVQHRDDGSGHPYDALGGSVAGY